MSKVNEYCNSLSRYLCYLLRHDPEGLHMDQYGYVLVKDLIEHVNTCSKFHMDEKMLRDIVKYDEKQRYTVKYSFKGKIIKCNQGHSIPWIKMELDTDITPPDELYHGTTEYAYGLIRRSSAIKKMKRKVWTKDEFLNKYDELRSQGLNDREIKERFNMDYMNINDFRNLRRYFMFFSDDKDVNEIIERLRKSIDEDGAMYINKNFGRQLIRWVFFKIAVTVLKNEGYEEWFMCISKSEEEKMTYRLLASPKIGDVNILEFVKKTGHLVVDKS